MIAPWPLAANKLAYSSVRKTRPDSRRRTHRMRSRRLFLFCLLLPLGALGCAGGRHAERIGSVEASFISAATPEDQLDSLAVWAGPDGERWLIATAKGSHRLRVLDARDGSHLRMVGSPGRGLGEFNRPNGIFAVDDLLLVVERDNARVQVFALPGFTPLGSFGEASLASPYGIWTQRMPLGGYQVFITDSYQDPGLDVPPEDRLDRRVREFHLLRIGDVIEARLVNTFGPVVAPGALRIVESIWGDAHHSVLLIAEEDVSRRGSELGLKLFDVDGQFRGRIVGADRFRGQPEGIALWQCADGSGYWLASDQSDENQGFLVFDRRDFAYRGVFRSDGVRNSDGIWLHQQPIEGFPDGVLYVSNDDQAVAAFDWRTIARSLGLAVRCQTGER